MAKERYNYSDHPGIDGFKSHLRSPSEIHPIIQERLDALALIEEEQEQLPIPDWLPRALIPHPDDQGLILTPFDQFDGMHPTIASQESIEAWQILWGYNLKLFNHPSRIAAMQKLEKLGFTPPRKSPGIIDKMIKRGRVPQLADLGHAPDIIGQEISEDTTQTHRTELLATGPFTTIRQKAFNYFGMGAMPDINGSVLAGITAAKMFSTFGIPEVGFFSDPKKQTALARAILEGLSIDDPLLIGRNEEEKKFILDHWRSCPVGVLEVNTTKALRRAELLANAGVTTFRIYGHTLGGDIVKTTRALRTEYPDAIIFSGQISNINIAKACEEAGADALITGVGGGGRCTTAVLAGLIPTMAPLGWQLRGEIKIPLVGEGGVVDHPVVAALIGYSMVNGSGSIGGGTLESPGGAYYLHRGGRLFKPYGGEASPRTKWLSNRRYGTGLPYMPEGEEKFKQLLNYRESMTQNMLTLFDSIILGAVVINLNHGPYLIQAFHEIGPEILFEKSRSGSYSQGTH